MLSRLILFTGCLLATICIADTATAQASKTPQNKIDVRTDYKQPGAPMPRLKLLVYRDSAKSTTAAAADEHKSKKHKKRHRGDVMPKDSTYLTEQDFDNGYNYMVMLFNPTCGHCQEMTKVMEKNLTVFNKTNLIFIATPMMRQYLPDFVTSLHTSDYPSFHIGMDSSGFVDNLFLYTMLPQINIYDADRKLVKIFTGDVSIDSLKKYLK